MLLLFLFYLLLGATAVGATQTTSEYPGSYSVKDQITATTTITKISTISTTTTILKSIETLAITANFTVDPEYTFSPSFDSTPRNYSTVTITDPTTGTSSNITYWVNSRLNAVHWGDVVWGSEDKLLRLSTGSSNSAKRGFGVQPQDNLRWPGGIIKYKYESQGAKDKHRLGVEGAIEDWLSWAPYLQFQELPISDEFTQEALTVTATPGDGCHSDIGYSTNTKQIQFDPTWYFWQLYSTYRHEVGHAIGLFHEHQRPDRDDYIRVNCYAFKPMPPKGYTCTVEDEDCCKNPDSPCCRGTTRSFEKINDPISKTYGPYDINSIMHYSGSSGATPYALSMEPNWVPSWLPDWWATGVGLVFRGLYSINDNYFITAGDAAAVCGIYHEICEERFPDGPPTSPLKSPKAPVETPPEVIPSEPVTSEPVSSEQIPSESSSVPTKPASFPDTTLPAPQKPTKETTGWSLSFPVHVFSINNLIEASHFIVVEGVRSINTNCLPLTVSESTLPDSGTLAPSGEVMTFESGILGLNVSPDTCCLRYYTASACDTVRGFEDTCGYNARTVMDIRSFHVYNCTGIWTGQAAKF